MALRSFLWFLSSTARWQCDPTCDSKSNLPYHRKIKMAVRSFLWFLSSTARWQCHHTWWWADLPRCGSVCGTPSRRWRDGAGGRRQRGTPRPESETVAMSKVWYGLNTRWRICFKQPRAMHIDDWTREKNTQFPNQTFLKGGKADGKHLRHPVKGSVSGEPAKVD